MTSVDEFAAGFVEEPGYLDYGRVGPLSRAVLAELQGHNEILSRARFGSLTALESEGERLRDAISALTGFSSEQVAFQPNTSTGLMQVMFGLTGGVLLSPAEFPSITYAVTRASEALKVVSPIWLQTDHGRVTPGQIREQLTAGTAAVAVSLVDSRTGYLADLEGIRQIIGDRLLVVDAIQGFGLVDAPYAVADVVCTGGQKWVRAGWGTGFLALSERALEFLTPVMSGFSGSDVEDPWDQVYPPSASARAFTMSNPDAIAEARLAGALEQVASVGIANINSVAAEIVEQVIDLADEYAIPLASPRDKRERAGIVVLAPAAEQLTVLTASLFNHGVSTTIRAGTVRLSIHAGTSQETLGMLRAALTSYASLL